MQSGVGEKAMGLLKDNKGRYRLTGKTTEPDLLAAAEGILKTKLERQGGIGNPRDASDLLRMRISISCGLDTRHRILDCQRLFTGTIDGASVHPREAVRAALTINASAAILSHNNAGP
jgi:DNA repair protein RadC